MTRCTVCGEPMPAGEEMFKFHGYSGPCPKPPLPKAESNVRDIIRSSIKVGAPGLSDVVIDAIVRSAMLKIRHHAGVELSEANDRLTDALKDALLVMELYQKRDEPSWDRKAAPASAIGKARIALGRACD